MKQYKFKLFAIFFVALLALTSCDLFTSTSKDNSTMNSNDLASDYTSIKPSNDNSISESVPTPPEEPIYCEEAIYNFSIHYGTDGNYAVIDGIKNPETATYANIPSYYQGLPVKKINISDSGSLNHVKLPDTLTELPKSTFVHCYYLRSIFIPSSVQRIESEFLENCLSSDRITIYTSFKSRPSTWDKKWDYQTVHYYLEEPYLTNTCYTIWNCEDYMFYNDGLIYAKCHHWENNKDNIYCHLAGMYKYSKEVIIPSEVEGNKVRNIGFCALSGIDIDVIYIPKTIKEIGLKKEYVDDKTYYRNIKFSSEDCYNFISSFNKIKHVFCEVDNYFYKDFPKTKNDCSGYEQFYYYQIIWNVKEFGTNIDGYLYTILNDETVTIADFFGSQTTINVPSSISSFPVTAIGAYAFSPRDIESGNSRYYEQVSRDKDYLKSTDYDDINYSRIKEIIVPDTIERIDEGAFFRCISLDTIQIDSHLEAIPDFCFTGCISLKKIITNNIILKTVGVNAFAFCVNFNESNLFKNLITIDDYAFYYCRKLNLTFPENVEEIGRDSFSNINILYIDKVNTKFDKNSYLRDSSSIHKVLCSFSKDKAPSTEYFSKWINNFLRSMHTSIIYSASTYGELDNGLEYVITKNDNDEKEAYITKFEHQYPYDQSQISVVIPDYVDDVPVTVIDSNAFDGSDFSGCRSIDLIELPSTLLRINNSAFDQCQFLKTVIMDKNITYIDKGAFSLCNMLETIFYKGTVDDFSKIDIDLNSNYMVNSFIPKVSYYSESEPTDDTHSYWRYVNNEPTKW